jgi:ecotin
MLPFMLVACLAIAATGMKRTVIHMDAKPDESAWKIELEVGKVMETDGMNHLGWGRQDSGEYGPRLGGGYSYSEAKVQGGMTSSLIGVPPVSPQVAPFVTIAGTGPLG